ncbi:hypothetical protein [Brevifollis gellanilyticus]|uniref:Uncharacterized protein n=1 Tax=Brevifollis gellanilyticus TaxID=748831 RepID=A0A512MBL2_9BACT|nr:hypothetical protein [Brevifollis gellanilyticus]GEP44125.1 hypothetical protein BGE01nite_34160 [Brevifollis gellanilyticus]
MSFRRNRGKAQAWNAWQETHRDRLIAWGVPHAVLEHEASWNYFLEHGYFTPPGNAEPVIDVDRMEEGLGKKLCLFLESDDAVRTSDALNRLQYLLKRGRHAEPTGEDVSVSEG